MTRVDDPLGAVLEGAGRSRRFRRGERLMLEGGRRRSVVVIRSGTVKIVATTLDGDEVTLAIRRQGDVIGDHSAVTGDRIGMGVVAVEDGELTALPADSYLELLRGSPAAMEASIRNLIEMLHDADSRIVDSVECTLDERVTRQLARLCGSEATPVSLPITQTDLATMIGTSRASVARALAGLREQGIVSTEHGRIIVNELAGRAG